MSKKDEVNQEELFTMALNAHGILFKKKVRSELEKAAGVRIAGEEYPVAFMEGGVIDLLVGASMGPEWAGEKTRYFLPVECKRAYVANKVWLLLRDPVQDCKLMYHIQGTDFSTENASAIETVCNAGRMETPQKGNRPIICMEGIEVDRAKFKVDTYKAASADAIWKAANQACMGNLRFMESELQKRDDIMRRKPDMQLPSMYVFPMIITNAPLLVCEPDVASIDVVSGNYGGVVPTQSHPWLVLHHPFPVGLKSQTESEKYVWPGEDANDLKQGILVLNSGKIADFFKWLDRTQIASKQH